MMRSHENLMIVSKIFLWVLLLAQNLDKTIAKKVSHCISDVGFLVDVSKSVKMHWNKEKMFIKELTKHIDLSPRGGHVAVTQFDNRGKLIVKFSDHVNMFKFSRAIDGMTFSGGGTNLNQGLKIAYTQMFSRANGIRRCAPKTLVLITDGQQRNFKYDAWKRTFENANIRVVVIGVGIVRKNVLMSLVKDEKDLHLAINFEQMLNKSFMRSITLCDVCCLEVVLYVKRRNTVITFVGRRTDDNTYWFGNKIMVSIAEIVGIDALVWKPEVESWTLLVEVFEGGENHIRELSVSNCNEKCPERCRSLEEEDFIEEITFSKRFSLEFKHLECCSG